MATSRVRDPLDAVREAVAGRREGWAEATRPDGPFPLAEEEVAHFGTVQRYNCWQSGPNSFVYQTLPEMFEGCFPRFLDREFIVYEGERCSYGEVISAAAALSAELQAHYAVARGSCVAVAGRNTPEWVISFTAASGFLGALTLPVNSWWMDTELRYGLEDSKAVLLLADDFVLERAAFLPEIGVAAICTRADGTASGGSGAARARSLSDVLAAGRERLPPLLQAVEPDGVGMLMYTSGTTSKPKGVVQTQRNIMAYINLLQLHKGTNVAKAPTTALLGSPLFHITGSHVALLGAIIDGSKLVMMRKWAAGRALELVEREKIVGLIGVPTMTYELVNHPDFSRYDTSSLVGVGGGGAPFAAPMIQKVADKFKNARARTGYGLTETGGATTMDAPWFPVKPSSCGVAVVNMEIAILGDGGQWLPTGEVGEICLRGAAIMKEYWGKPEKTAEVFHIDSEGKLWFRSGDIGTLDHDGFLYILDRAKDIIIRGGENISCAEVEAALLEHPAVAEVAAVGVPDERLGEQVAVAIVFKEQGGGGAAQPPIEELQRHALARLPPFKVPAEYYPWTDGNLPRGATEKIQKQAIRDRIPALRSKPSASKL